MKRCAVIGAGSWGTAVACLAASHVDDLALWAHSSEVVSSINRTHKNPRYISSCKLPLNIKATNLLKEAVDGTEALILATPSDYVRATCEQLQQLELDPQLPVLLLTKGMESGTGKLLHEVVDELLGKHHPLAVLSGPNHAEEVSSGMVSATVIASMSEATAALFRDLLQEPAFRIYLSHDVIGIEVCGAMKNVIAIASGIALGLGMGDNARAALMTRGLAEIGRFTAAYGGDPLTCMGLAGMGDMIATCTSPHSRNRSFGLSFARDKVTLEEYERTSHMVVEGARAARAACKVSREKNIEAPLTCACAGLLAGELSLDKVVELLLDRPLREEFYGFSNYDSKR